MLYPILNKKSSIQKKCSLLIYKQILRSLLTYACSNWGKCGTTQISKIQIFQNKVLRIIANAPGSILYKERKPTQRPSNPGNRRPH